MSSAERVHLLSTASGIPVEFVFLPGAANDVRGLGTLPLNLPSGSEVYGDSGYTDYTIEDDGSTELAERPQALR